jgi:hypothetical protein
VDDGLPILLGIPLWPIQAFGWDDSYIAVPAAAGNLALDAVQGDHRPDLKRTR